MVRPKQESVRNETKIICLGLAMIACGLILFYSIQTKPGLELVFRMLKHAGTFVGLMGIGISIAGMLLYLISRNPRPPGLELDP